MDSSQHVFRVQQPSKWISETTPFLDKPESPEETYHTRRAHKKSRRGCDYCKGRRRKCDERKPRCSLCEKKSVSCSYTGTKQLYKSIPETSLTIAPRLPASRWPGPRTPPVLSNYSRETCYTKYDLYLLDHFVKRVAPYFELIQSPAVRGIYSGKAVNLAKQYPFVMHAMIALAACSLQLASIDGECYRMPEAFHCQLATRGLRNAVVSFQGVNDADAVLTTSMLLNSLTFCTADYLDKTSSQLSLRWDWLRFQIGITELLYRTKPFHPESIWLPMFKSINNFSITELPQNDIDIRLAAFCDITPDSTPQNNPYFDFWEQLAPLVTRTCRSEYVRLYINAVGGVNHNFIGLLEQQDARALLLFAHWTGLMSKIGNLWVSQRMRSMCLNLCRVVERLLRGGDRELLKMPAEACGFAFSSCDD